jgi:hypothetical protein
VYCGCRRVVILNLLAVCKGKPEPLMCGTSNRCIAVTNTYSRNAVVACACELILLVCVVFCVSVIFGGAPKFDVRLVTDGTRNK